MFFGKTSQSTFEVDPEMNKTAAGNEFGDAYDFRPKSIKNIMKTISEKDPLTAPLAGNFVYGQRTFQLGGNDSDGTPRVSRKRYSTDNPYFSGNNIKKAGQLLFSLTNYAIPDNSEFKRMFFPPYIQSFSENTTNNWNSHDFLGRPEPVFTYNNSTRGASITFYVLTDYAQDVEIGTDWKSVNLDRKSVNLDRIYFNTKSTSSTKNISEVDHFSERWKYYIDIANQKNELRKINADILIEKAAIQKLVDEMKGGNLENVDWSSTIPTDEGIKDRLSKLSSRIEQLDVELAKNMDRFQELGNTDATQEESSKAFSESKLENENTVATALGTQNTADYFMVERLSEMKQNLQYQPAYFSGDKVDFNRKMTFLQRLFRPRAAEKSENMGFSFTAPPVSHIRLGDWLNHDIIITDMNIEYSDSTWSLENISQDGVGVQPMFAVVTLNFSIIGQYSDQGGGEPLLADDTRGFYNQKISLESDSIEVGNAVANLTINPNNTNQLINNPDFGKLE